MSKPKALPRWTTFALVAILLFSFVTRIYHLAQPPVYVFDEVYHAITAKLIARNDAKAFEWWNPPVEPNTAVDWLHPPYAKYTQALGIRLFGETTFGWRIGSVLFGVGVVWLTFKLAQELFNRPELSLIAAGLASLDGLLLVMSRIAMNDIHVTFFILMTVWFYLRYRRNNLPLWPVGIAAGLALGSKWSGLFAVIIVMVGEVQRLIEWWLRKKKSDLPTLPLATKQLLTTILCLIILPFALYFASYTLMFAQGKDLAHLRELHRQIWWYQTNLEATHSYQSRPIEWFFNWRPVWFYVEYGTGQVTNIYAQGNPALHVLGIIAVALSVSTIVTAAIKKPREVLAFTPLKAVTFAYAAVWLPWVFSPRIMFYYHYTPAVPFLAILCAYWLYQAWEHSLRTVVLGVLAVVAIVFCIWYPNWVGLPVSNEFAQAVYFILPNWK